MCVTVEPDVRIFGGLEGSGRWAMYKKTQRKCPYGGQNVIKCTLGFLLSWTKHGEESSLHSKYFTTFCDALKTTSQT